MFGSFDKRMAECDNPNTDPRLLYVIGVASLRTGLGACLSHVLENPNTPDKKTLIEMAYRARAMKADTLVGLSVKLSFSSLDLSRLDQGALDAYLAGCLDSDEPLRLWRFREAVREDTPVKPSNEILLRIWREYRDTPAHGSHSTERELVSDTVMALMASPGCPGEIYDWVITSGSKRMFDTLRASSLTPEEYKAEAWLSGKKVFAKWAIMDIVYE